MNKVFFDIKFTGLHLDAQPISIGLVDHQNKRSFYAEFIDFDKTLIDAWTEDNIVGNLKFKNHAFLKEITKTHTFSLSETITTTYMKDNKENISNELNRWLDYYKDLEESDVQFVSDCSHYDFALLIDLICGNALKLPSYITPVCDDINTLIADYYDVSLATAFDYRRNNIIIRFVVDGFTNMMTAGSLSGSKANEKALINFYIYNLLSRNSIYFNTIEIMEPTRAVVARHHRLVLIKEIDTDKFSIGHADINGIYSTELTFDTMDEAAKEFQERKKFM